MKKKMPLLIAGGCGLNCDWNTKWKETGLFPEVFVPPVANDSGSAIGTAIDAQFHLTGNPKIDWNVYSGLSFITAHSFDLAQYDLYETNYEMIADILAKNAAQLEQYRAGKVALFGFFVGQTMKAMQGKANPQLVNALLRKALA